MSIIDATELVLLYNFRVYIGFWDGHDLLG